MDFPAAKAIVALLAVAVLATAPFVFGRGGVVSGRRSFTSFPQEVSSAAHRFIDMPWLRPSYLGGHPRQIGERREHIARKREQARHIDNAELRECALSYLDYYESRLPDEERELVDEISKRRLDAYRERRKGEEEKVQALLRAEGITR